MSPTNPIQASRNTRSTKGNAFGCFCSHRPNNAKTNPPPNPMRGRVAQGARLGTVKNLDPAGGVS